MTIVKPEPEDAPQRVARWWGVAIVPILWFLSGGLGFFYEVAIGHDTKLAALCILWAAGGPARAADGLIRMWLK